MPSFHVFALLQGIVQHTNERAFIVNFNYGPIIGTLPASFKIQDYGNFSCKLDYLENILGSQARIDKLGFGIDQHTQAKVYYSLLVC